jgi:hypothetical protein
LPFKCNLQRYIEGGVKAKPKAGGDWFANDLFSAPVTAVGLCTLESS